MAKVQFSDYSDGSGAWTLYLNPSDLSLPNAKYSLTSILDGAPAKQSAYFNDGPHILRWSSISNNYSQIAHFLSMIATLSSYIDSIKYVNYQDIEYRVGGTQWEKVRVQDVKLSINTGGVLHYNVETILTPEV